MKNKFIVANIFLAFSLFLLPHSSALAQTEYKLLAPIPLGECSGASGEDCKTSTSEFIPGVFRLMVSIATGLAVVMLIYAGIKYMSTDAFTGKEEAKGIIENALWGLLLAMCAWLIVFTILPSSDGKITFDLNITPIEIATTTPVSGGPLPSSCAGCVSLSPIPQKAGGSCSTPNNCQVEVGLKNKLTTLHQRFPLVVTESYPPTRTHQSGCHRAGTCVDVRAVPDNQVYRFIFEASQVGLKSVYEVESEARKNAIIGASCASAAQNCRGALSSCIAVLPGQITAEHFSVYNQPPCL